MNTKVALADDYNINWYSASRNPISVSFSGSNFSSSTLSAGYETDLGKYGYVDFLVTTRVTYTCSGFQTGYTYKYRPYSQFMIGTSQSGSNPANYFPLTGFTLDGIYLDSYSWRGALNDVKVVRQATSNTPNNWLPFVVVFEWDWFSGVPSSTIELDLHIRFRAYCSNVNALTLQQLGEFTLTPYFGQYQNNEYVSQTGAYIADFVPLELDLGIYNNSDLMTGYIFDIRNALIQQPDTDYTAALDSAQSALDTEQDARDDVFQQVDQFYMTDADTLLTLDDIDSNVGVGLDFWFDWVNAYFNKAEEVDANKPLTLNIIFNFISRLF